MVEDDNIPDPSINLLNDPALALRFLTAISKSVGSQAEGFKGLVSTMDELSSAVKELVKAENQRQVDRAVDEARFKAIESNQEGMTKLLTKYLDKTDNLTKVMNDSCDITSSTMKKYTDDKVSSVWNKVLLAAVIASALVGVIWYDSKDDMNYHIRNDNIHHAKGSK